MLHIQRIYFFLLLLGVLVLFSVEQANQTAFAEKNHKATGNYSTIGVEFYNLTENIRSLLANSKEQGIVIVKVYKGMPGEEADLQAGDIVVSANGAEYKNFQELTAFIELTPVDTPILFEISRKGSQSFRLIKLVKAEIVKNSEFQEYYTTRLQYGRLSDELQGNMFNPALQKLCLSNLQALMEQSLNRATHNGDLLLIEKYTDLKRNFNPLRR